MPFRSRFLHRALVPALALSAGAACAQPQQAPLDLDTALALAAARAPLLRASEAAAQAAREQAVAAGQRPDPMLRFGINNLPIDGPDRFSLTRDFMTMRSIGVMQEFTRDDKRSARAARFEREADTALARRDERLAALRRDTAMAWLDRHYLERMRELLLNQRDEARLQIEAAEAAYRGGRGSQADVFMARAQVGARSTTASRQVDARIAHGHDRARTLGRRPTPRRPARRAARRQRARARRRASRNAARRLPAARRARTRDRQARADVAVARAERQRDWSVELMFSQRGSAVLEHGVADVSVPLPMGPREPAGPRGRGEAGGRRADARRARGGLRANTWREVRAWLQEWQSDRDAAQRATTRSCIPLAASARAPRWRPTAAAAGRWRPCSRRAATRSTPRIERLRLEMEAARAVGAAALPVPATPRTATRSERRQTP